MHHRVARALDKHRSDVEPRYSLHMKRQTLSNSQNKVFTKSNKSYKREEKITKKYVVHFYSQFLLMCFLLPESVGMPWSIANCLLRCICASRPAGVSLWGWVCPHMWPNHQKSSTCSVIKNHYMINIYIRLQVNLSHTIIQYTKYG